MVMLETLGLNRGEFSTSVFKELVYVSVLYDKCRVFIQRLGKMEYRYLYSLLYQYLYSL